MTPVGLREITFSLRRVSSFRLDLRVWTVRRQPENLVGRWDRETYRRVLVVERLAEMGYVS